MPKQLMLQIIQQAIEGSLIDGAHEYRNFLSDLGEAITNSFGGDVGMVKPPMDNSDTDNGRWLVGFYWNDSAPEDGGVYAQYNTDITIEEWRRGA